MKILNSYAIGLHDYSNGKPGHHNDYREQTDQALTSIINLVDKVIGEDEPYSQFNIDGNEFIETKNELRAEQRAKLKGDK